MKYLMFYEMAADAMTKIQAHFPAHQARLLEFHQQGTLLMAGPYGMPPIGALGIFTTQEAAESFASGDPFVINGVVAKYIIQPWSEALAPQ